MAEIVGIGKRYSSCEGYDEPGLVTWTRVCR